MLESTSNNGGSGGAFRFSWFSSQSTSPKKARKKSTNTYKSKGRQKASKYASFAADACVESAAIISDESQPKKQTVEQEIFISDGMNVYVKQDLTGNKSKDPIETNHNHKPNRDEKHDQVSHSPLPMMLISRILKGIPQNPHFLQLGRYSEMARENLIVAWDRTFEETVDQIHALRASEFWVRSRKLWKTLGDLQSLGYSVLVLRKRVVELGDVMLEHRKCEHEIHGLRDRAEFHRMEKSRVESMILNLQAQARREHEWMVQVLENAADKEQDLPKLEGVLAKIASEAI